MKVEFISGYDYQEVTNDLDGLEGPAGAIDSEYMKNFYVRKKGKVIDIYINDYGVKFATVLDEDGGLQDHILENLKIIRE